MCLGEFRRDTHLNAKCPAKSTPTKIQSPKSCLITANPSLGEWNKFTGRDDASDREWWTDQIMQLQQVPEVYYAKELEKEQARKVEKAVQQSLDRGRGRGMGMDIDFD